NDWRAFGPWTDLYALGCVAYELVSGYPPFSRPSDDRAQDAMSLMVAHLRAPVPPLRAKMPVPEGLGDFVRRLLAKEPAGRYRFAADAMRALETLPAEAPEALRREPQTTIPVGPMAVISTAEPGTLGSAEAASSPLPSDLLLTSARPIDALAATGLANESALLTAIIDPSAMAPAGFDVGRHSPLDVPLIMPTDWRELQPNAAPPPLQGVGRSLFGQREPRSCGRGVERDALWATLRAVVAGQGARAIVLEAPSGYGKRHLSQWIAYRAHEMGAAVLLRTDHERPHGPACGLGPMFARALRVGELSSARRVQRIAAALGLPAHDERVLALSSAIDAESPTLSDVREVLAASDQRFDAYAAALGRVAGDRAAVIRLDNVQYGEDATRFAGYVLAHRSELPALLLLTVRTDALRPGSPEQVALAELLQSPSAACLPLGPLPPGPYAELLQSLLPLRVDLVESIIQRTAGCPLFGLELLQHWIRTEALEDSPEGFRLRSGAERIAPEGLQAVWRARIDEALAGEGQGAQCFELAAVLGLVVDNAEWTAVCAHAGLHADPAVTERMLDARLIRRVDGGRWTFTHAMVREALQQRVRRAGRWAWANRLCADMLLMRGENEPIRLAEHLMAAGDHAAAIGPLVAADDMRHEATDLPRVRRLLSQR
ncbi:MAG: hypothetical protein KC620_23945, partial [Myxococcales bacterium]|nr:hypothetical protein [Myxococcales bacterium]